MALNISIRTIYVGNDDTNAVSVDGLIKLTAEVQAAIALNEPICFVGAQPGRFFCSGFNVVELTKLSQASVQQHFKQFLHFIRLVFTAPVPVFCQAEGHAVGIGAALCLAADLTSLSPRAKFRFPEATIGLTLFSDVVKLLHYRLSAPKQAESLLMQAQTLTAVEAQQLGLIDVVLDPTGSVDAALPMEEYCSQFFTSVYGGMKQLCRSDVLHTAIDEQVSFFMGSWEKSLKAHQN